MYHTWILGGDGCQSVVFLCLKEIILETRENGFQRSSLKTWKMWIYAFGMLSMTKSVAHNFRTFLEKAGQILGRKQESRRRSGDSNTADFHVSVPMAHVSPFHQATLKKPEKPEKTPQHFAVITPKQFFVVVYLINKNLLYHYICII